MTQLSPRLFELGATLERAAAADLARVAPRRRRTSRRRAALIAVAAAIVIPGGAIAASSLISNDEVAKSLPAGTLSLAGTVPTCTVVKQDVEFHCTLAKAPRPEVSDWKGTVEPTVDKTKHVNGGCRSLRSDGREWQCYIGQVAVDQKIIGQGFLGEFAPSPGQG
jgi:hypothetical protein